MQSNARFVDDHVTRLIPVEYLGKGIKSGLLLLCMFHGTRDGHPGQPTPCQTYAIKYTVHHRKVRSSTSVDIFNKQHNLPVINYLIN